MTDQELMELMLRVDPQTKRIPPGVRAIVDAVITAEREACVRIVEKESIPYENTSYEAALKIRMRSNVDSAPENSVVS